MKKILLRGHLVDYLMPNEKATEAAIELFNEMLPHFIKQLNTTFRFLHSEIDEFEDLIIVSCVSDADAEYIAYQFRIQLYNPT